MKLSLILFCILYLPFILIGQEKVNQPFFVGTFTSEGAEGIYRLNFDPSSGKITSGQVFKGVDNPNFLKKSPDGSYLYVVTRPRPEVDPLGGSVAAYRINRQGGIEFINKQTSHGNGPCYVDISADGKWVAVANYGGGSVAVYPVGEGGALMPATGIVKHKGSGPDKARQNEPHAHSIVFSGDGNTLYAADLGTDQLLVYQLNKETGMLSPADQPHVMMPPGSGPRHFAFTSYERWAYVANELLSTVSVLERKNGRLEVVQTLSALPEGYAGTSYCADIHLSNDEQFVYVSNRGHQSIAVYKRGADGRLLLLSTAPVQGDWPRNFAIDPSGRYLLVANQRSHNITVFRLKNGIPEYTGEEYKVPAPVCIEF